MRKLILPFFAFFVLGILTQCKKETTNIDCTGSTPTYVKDVKPILDGNCASSGCHAASNPSDGINLATYAGAKAAGGSSKFLDSIQHKGGAKAMPKSASKMSDDKIKTLYCWVQNGMPEN
jgi:mono/diheme cytochrome c family protein